MSNVRQRKLRVESSDDEDETSPRGKSAGGTFSSASTAQSTQTNAAVAESRLRKVIVRSVVGFFMVTSFVGIVWAGHLYVSALVVLIQVGASGCYYFSCHVAMGVLQARQMFWQRAEWNACLPLRR